MRDWKERIEDATREGDPDQLITSREAAELLGVSRFTVERWGRSGELPRVEFSARAIRYKVADVRRLIRERTV